MSNRRKSYNNKKTPEFKQEALRVVQATFTPTIDGNASESGRCIFDRKEVRLKNHAVVTPPHMFEHGIDCALISDQIKEGIFWLPEVLHIDIQMSAKIFHKTRS